MSAPSIGPKSRHHQQLSPSRHCAQLLIRVNANNEFQRNFDSLSSPESSERCDQKNGRKKASRNTICGYKDDAIAISNYLHVPMEKCHQCECQRNPYPRQFQRNCTPDEYKLPDDMRSVTESRTNTTGFSRCHQTGKDIHCVDMGNQCQRHRKKSCDASTQTHVATACCPHNCTNGQLIRQKDNVGSLEWSESTESNSFTSSSSDDINFSFSSENVEEDSKRHFHNKKYDRLQLPESTIMRRHSVEPNRVAFPTKSNSCKPKRRSSDSREAVSTSPGHLSKSAENIQKTNPETANFMRWTAIESKAEIKSVDGYGNVNVYNMAVFKETGDLIVTDSDRVKMFRTSGERATYGTPTWPRHGRGITVTNSGQEVAVCHLNEICIYGKNGQIIKQFKNDYFLWCWGIAQSKDGQFAITDSKRGAIYVTNEKFEIIKVIGNGQELRSASIPSRAQQKRKKSIFESVLARRTSASKDAKRENENDQKLQVKQENSTFDENKKSQLAQLIAPRYVAVSSIGRILVTDTVQKTLLAINPDCTIAFKVGGNKSAGCRACIHKHSCYSFDKDMPQQKLRSVTLTHTTLNSTENVAPEGSTEKKTTRSSFIGSVKANTSIGKLLGYNKAIGRGAPELERGPNRNVENGEAKAITENSQINAVCGEHHGTAAEPSKSTSHAKANGYTKDGHLLAFEKSIKHKQESMHQLTTETKILPQINGRSISNEIAFSDLKSPTNVQSPRTPEYNTTNKRSCTGDDSNLDNVSCDHCTLADPRGLCLDDYDNIVVADKQLHRVSLFTSQGRFVRHLLTEVDGIQDPKVVCLARHNTLAVADGSGKIKFFTFHFN